MKKVLKMLLALLAVSVLITSVSFAADESASQILTIKLSAVDALKTSKLTDDDVYTVKIELTSVTAPTNDNGVVDGYSVPANPTLGTASVLAGSDGSITSWDATTGILVFKGNLNTDATIEIPITFSGAGHYTYTITETDKTNANEVKVAAEYEEKFVVAYENGKLAVLDNSTAEGGTKDSNDGIVALVHEQAPKGDVIVSNTVTGNVGDKDKDFTYTVEVGGTGKYDIVDEEGNVIATVEAGTPTTVTLKDGETFTIKDLPQGVDYTITETVPTGYEVTDLTKDGTPVDKPSEGVVSGTVAPTNDVDYVNNADIAPATALIIDMTPYIVAALFVVAAGAFLMKKRSHTSEF